MKSRDLRLSHSNGLRAFIRDATAAPAKDLAQIERIMRDEIFHSTLDWQNREQLADAAHQAFALLNQNRELYDLDQTCRQAMFQKMCADSALLESDTPSNRSAVVDADNRYRALQTTLLVRLDELTPN